MSYDCWVSSFRFSNCLNRCPELPAWLPTEGVTEIGSTTEKIGILTGKSVSFGSMLTTYHANFIKIFLEYLFFVCVL